jgi:glucose-6-phosphate isomerase
MAFRFVSSFPQGDEQDVRNRTTGVDEAIAKGELGFATLPYQSEETLAAIYGLADEVRGQFRNIIVIGVGGPDLGTRAIHRALNHIHYNQLCEPRLYFVGDTTDPVPLLETLAAVDLAETLVVMVSKSGNTVEQMSAFLVLREKLQEKMGDEFSGHIVAITDPGSGTLRDLVNQEGYRSLEVPPTVGGRFAVLSAVGLFPLCLVNIDTQSLLKGARDVLENEREAARMYAAVQCEAYNQGRNIHVMMPYVYSLKEVGFWFRQLWAESLGKAQSLDGSTVNVGPTPVAALGPTDQHSQVQLYREGPDDKTFTFIVASNPTAELAVPTSIPNHPNLEYMKGLGFHDILQAEQAGTEEALQEGGRPTYRIELDQVDAYHIGGLIMFFELATAYAGALLAINPYDQPGVERGKELARAKLSR